MYYITEVYILAFERGIVPEFAPYLWHSTGPPLHRQRLLVKAQKFANLFLMHMKLDKHLKNV